MHNSFFFRFCAHSSAINCFVVKVIVEKCYEVVHHNVHEHFEIRINYLIFMKFVNYAFVVLSHSQ